MFVRAVVQRVQRAAVRVEGHVIAEIGTGLVILLGIGRNDTSADCDWLIHKLLGLRIFPDSAGRMNRSVSEVGGGLLVVPQFTLYGELRKGFRPSFSDAMPPTEAESLYREFMRKLRVATNLFVAEGRFAASMQVELVNDGPVTLLLESPAKGAHSAVTRSRETVGRLETRPEDLSDA